MVRNLKRERYQDAGDKKTGETGRNKVMILPWVK